MHTGGQGKQQSCAHPAPKQQAVSKKSGASGIGLKYSKEMRVED